MVRNPPSPAPADPYDLFLAEYFQTDPLNRLDIITCTRDIGGILFFADDHVSTLTNFRVQRLGKTDKEIQGITGSPPSFLVWKADVMKAVANFGSWSELGPNDDDLPDVLDMGNEFRKVMSANKNKNDVIDDLRNKLLPSKAFPKDDKIDILPFYFPLAIPVFHQHGTFDGPITDTLLLQQLFDVHPALSL